MFAVAIGHLLKGELNLDGRVARFDGGRCGGGDIAGERGFARAIAGDEVARRFDVPQCGAEAVVGNRRCPQLAESLKDVSTGAHDVGAQGGGRGCVDAIGQGEGQQDL